MVPHGNTAWSPHPTLPKSQALLMCGAARTATDHWHLPPLWLQPPPCLRTSAFPRTSRLSWKAAAVGGQQQWVTEWQLGTVPGSQALGKGVHAPGTWDPLTSTPARCTQGSFTPDSFHIGVGSVTLGQGRPVCPYCTLV